jgi:peptide/nickel transport system permease protein
VTDLVAGVHSDVDAGAADRLPGEPVSTSRVSYWQAARHSPVTLAAMIVLVLWVITAVFGPIIFGHVAQQQDLTRRLLPPFHTKHGFMEFLGTDPLGRSVLARLMVGARTALVVSGLAVLLAAVMGTLTGLVSGFYGRSRIDVVIMRVVDMVMAFPAILLALTLLYVFSPSIVTLVIVLSLTRMPVYIRVARAQVLELRELAFVDVARGLGKRARNIIFSDLQPLVTPTIGTVAMLDLSTTLLAAAGLSFIGVGLRPPTVDWGLMVSDGQSYLTEAWWVSVLPGAAVAIVAWSANITSNWLRSMADPSERSRMLAARFWKRPPQLSSESTLGSKPMSATLDLGSSTRREESGAPGPSRVLDVRGLAVDLFSPNGIVHAVRGIDIALAQGESLAIVGESGSGKSVTAKAILGLMEPPGAAVQGEVLFDGTDVLSADRQQLGLIRGKGISLVFQDALTSLDPVMTVGKQIAEVLRLRMGMSRSAANVRAIELMTEVGIREPERRFGSYPYELSGGMRQRVCIALAISTRPKLLIADEPTTSLDVTVQARVLRLIVDLQRRYGMALLFITHDLRVARRVADRIAVMYAGQIVESGRLSEVFDCPQHPYTRALIKSYPKSAGSWRDLRPIAGTPLDARWSAAGCTFAARCDQVQDLCRRDAPILEVREGRASRCHFSLSES